MRGNRLILATVCALGAMLLGLPAAKAADETEAKSGPAKVTIVKKDDGSFQLLRDGKAYFIKGGGGDASKKLLSDIGGNSFRTWGIGGDTQRQLDEAQNLGMTVSLGTWLGHKSYFSYTNEKQNEEQKARVKGEVEKFKNHPALLIWALGNEMENDFKGDAVIPVYKHIEELAKMVHELDPNHPTMTVIAEIGSDKVTMLNKYCPDIDIIGINSYGGCASLAKRYVEQGGTRPYIVTEFGPAGTWESKDQLDGNNLMRELDSGEKAKAYAAAYKGTIAEGHPLSFGCYAFAWGSKQEATATWFGLILTNNGQLYQTKAVDVLEEFWTGKPPAVKVPEIKSAKIEGVDPKVGCLVQPGGVVKASAEIEDPQGLPLTYKWHLFRDAENYNTGGATQAATTEYPMSIVKNGEAKVEVKMPRSAGAYRLYLFVYNTKGGVATLNFPIKSAGETIPATAEEQAEMEKLAKGKEAKLPFTVYAEDGEKAPWSPTGFMGSDISVMSIDGKCTDNPHAGKTCLKFVYGAKGGWGGIVWQDPDNDWGLMPGGFNLTGAKALTFWARGAKGGEKASFGVGLLNKDPRKESLLFWDTGTAKLADVILTTEWKQYSVPLDGKDLSRIKTGFWFVSGPTGGGPTTFYLDDIVFSAEAPKGQ